MLTQTIFLQYFENDAIIVSRFTILSSNDTQRVECKPFSISCLDGTHALSDDSTGLFPLFWVLCPRMCMCNHAASRLVCLKNRCKILHICLKNNNPGLSVWENTEKNKSGQFCNPDSFLIIIIIRVVRSNVDPAIIFLLLIVGIVSPLWNNS